ncbi:glycoside hydrolase family 29 protein [Serendipita vermifera MAFF 305830]|uniref:alpha-L-fucosidase n=1 Tax=Serendipita vermifera MAFF 305830 TaxID=933852 RepID=A0A0C3AHW5_SERVB|nr:glycoside hydrolase family 29 protein [Serendipita vermifera MAFF 305830]
MILFEQPLIQWLLAWSSSLYSSPQALHSHKYHARPISITRLFDSTGTTNFDGQGAYYPAHLLPHGVLKSENVDFALPKWGNDRPDNVISNGQQIEVDLGHVREFHVLYAGDWIDGETGARFSFEFEDGTSQSVECSVKNWWTLHWLNSGPIQLPYHGTPNGHNHNTTQIHHWSTYVHSASPLQTIRLPVLSSYNKLHVFAISLVPAYVPSRYPALLQHALGKKKVRPALGIKHVRPTKRMVEEGPHQGSPVVDVTVSNLMATLDGIRKVHGSHLDGNYTVSVVGKGVHTVVPGRIRRLMPGDDARVDVGIKLSKKYDTSTFSPALHVELHDDSGRLVFRGEKWKMDLSSIHAEYEPTKDSLMTHETPRWWRNAKFGIFIHWGIYSVPAWVPTGYYEAWYFPTVKYSMEPPSKSLWRGKLARNQRLLDLNYHQDFIYDDFIPGFTAAKFNASAWVDLFANAGAKYFVLVTKHHDGFSLFDTGNTTHRSSVHLGPKRDLIDELMLAAKERQPQLKRGTYYSMPEWFNPAFAKYGFGNWPGGLAHNAFNASKLEPYTGHLEGKDYLEDIQAAHMRLLADRYETDIMWCDIGGPNKSAEVAAEWYNNATKAGRQVTMNNRCGIAPDFDTPEYARFSSIQTRSWETSEGIDPYCYGYNQRTKDEDYRSSKEIIHTLVDIVSKNGNYLLNLGPTGEGEIIPAMTERVLEVGKWLGHSGGCVYETTYSFPGAEEGDLRFTTTTDTFCIVSFKPPMPVSRENLPEVLRRKATDDESYALVTVNRPVPILAGDSVRLLGGTGEALAWAYVGTQLQVLVTQEEVDRVQLAWAFEIRYV